jgi:hypothetical protein
LAIGQALGYVAAGITNTAISAQVETFPWD